MVGFANHTFSIPTTNKENWFRLLDKYFNGAKFTIISNGNIISTGILNYKWLMDNTVGATGMIVLQSNRIFDNWEMCCTSQTL